MRGAPRLPVPAAGEPAGEVRKVSVRGPNVVLSYRGLPEETARAVRNGWLRTGGMGRLDAAGFLF